MMLPSNINNLQLVSKTIFIYFHIEITLILNETHLKK